VINQTLYPNLTSEASKFEPIIVMAQVPNGVIVNPSKVSATTLPEFLAHLKANPGKVTSATQGNGTTSHLTSEMLQLMAGVKVQHVPYRGTAPALQDLVAGNVDFMCDNLGVSLPLVQAGKLRLLAVATAKPMASLPKVPTVAQTLPGFESVAWYAVVAPPKTPKAITEKINADINEALRDPAIQERLKKLSAEVVGGSTAETAKYLREEVDRWNKVIKDANVKIGG
jgi:tripartite-type tricarboxylate transporter receptor subunit TctC